MNPLEGVQQYNGPTFDNVLKTNKKDELGYVNWNDLWGKKVDYYYPNSTRYIGHNPEVPGDETIHEFPSYSSVLGDLHAHMVNIIFVLLVVGLALSWAFKMEKKNKLTLKEALLQPEILLIGFSQVCSAGRISGISRFILWLEDV